MWVGMRWLGSVLFSIRHCFDTVGWVRCRARKTFATYPETRNKREPANSGSPGIRCQNGSVIVWRER